MILRLLFVVGMLSLFASSRHLESLPPVIYDEETNKIIRYITGIYRFSHEDLFMMTKRSVALTLKEKEYNNKKSTSEIISMNELCFIEFCTLAKQNGALTPEDYPQFFDTIPVNYYQLKEDFIDHLLPVVEYDYARASFVWNLAKKYRIYIRTRHRNGFPSAWYNPFTKTINIPSPNSYTLDVLLVEIAHAEQVYNQPLRSSIRLVRGGVRTIARMFASYPEHYNKEYDRVGSLEHEAHTIIRDKYNKEIANRKKENDESSINTASK